jgi:hypothetical protein
MIDLSILDINLIVMIWIILLLIFIAIFECIRFKKFEKKYLKTTEIIPKARESSSSSEPSFDSELSIQMALKKEYHHVQGIYLLDYSVSGEGNFWNSLKNNW